jgi:hypothetical protein
LEDVQLVILVYALEGSQKLISYRFGEELASILSDEILIGEVKIFSEEIASFLCSLRRGL